MYPVYLNGKLLRDCQSWEFAKSMYERASEHGKAFLTNQWGTEHYYSEPNHPGNNASVTLKKYFRMCGVRGDVNV